MVLERILNLLHRDHCRAILCFALSTPLVVALLCKVRPVVLALSARPPIRSQDCKEWCVVRCAAKDQKTRAAEGGNRSDQRKLQCVSLDIRKDGVAGITQHFFRREMRDYNNYRAGGRQGRFEANTRDRAVSLMTVSAYEDLRRKLPSARIPLGDMGENLLVDGPSHITSGLSVGTKLRIGHEVEIEITEVNNPCYRFAYAQWADEGKRLFGENWWDNPDLALKGTGGRGWLAKVLVEGKVVRGAKVVIFQS